MSEPESDHQELPAGISQGTALENERCLYSDRRAWEAAHPLQNDETVGTGPSKDPDEHHRYHGDLFEKQSSAAGNKGFALAFRRSDAQIKPASFSGLASRCAVTKGLTCGGASTRSLLSSKPQWSESLDNLCRARALMLFRLTFFLLSSRPSCPLASRLL